MAYFPFFTDLAGKRGLIIGGGRTALGKAERLLPFGPFLTVVAPEVLPQLTNLARVTVLPREFRTADLDRYPDFVIAATDDRQLNRLVSACCKAKGIPVNVVDTPGDGTFLFPALIRRGPLTVGISTSGASPTAAVLLKEKIDSVLPDDLGDILTWLKDQRPAIISRTSDPDQRKAIFERLTARSFAENRPLTAEETNAVMEAAFKEV